MSATIEHPATNHLLFIDTTGMGQGGLVTSHKFTHCALLGGQGLGYL